MPVPTRYVHVGFPKAASSSLQNFYFAVHPECYHLGLGYQSRGNRYVNEEIEILSEVDLRLKKHFLWDGARGRARIEAAAAAAEEGGYRAVGLSNEFLSFALGNEVDTADKASRLHEIFGPGTRAVIVVREQFGFLRSLYLEMLKGGYGGSFRNFLEYTLLYQVRSWATDICYDNMWRHYARVFGEDNVCMLAFEQLKEDTPGFLGRIAGALGISDSVTELRAVNTQREELNWYEQLRRYNERFPHEFGARFYEPFNMNRMRAYFHNELKLAVPHDRLADDMLRIPFSQAANAVVELSKVRDINLDVPEALGDELRRMFAPSNRRLMEATGLPLDRYGYTLD